MGGGARGSSAPFRRRSSATGKALRGEAVESERPIDEGEDVGPGVAGSAAARAKNTACVPRDLSTTLGFPWRASA